MLSARASAKINLGLHVLRKRGDGFHDVETVLVPIGWSDEVTVESSRSLTFTCDDASLNNTDNLCLQAAHLLRDRTGKRKGARIHLSKRLPYGAGLGGGSSDAAAVLRLLDQLWNLEMEDDALAAIAAELGSDVPFFLLRSTAYATGRGVDLTPIEQDGTPLIIPYDIVVALPNVRVSTADAYWQVVPNDVDRPDLVALVRSLDLDRWKEEMVNDFEATVLGAIPEIAALKKSMYEAGAGYAAMSGSGSAVFGVFTDSSAALAASEALRNHGFPVWHGKG